MNRDKKAKPVETREHYERDAQTIQNEIP
jgi:hypothetical protein